MEIIVYIDWRRTFQHVCLIVWAAICMPIIWNRRCPSIETRGSYYSHMTYFEFLFRSLSLLMLKLIKNKCKFEEAHRGAQIVVEFIQYVLFVSMTANDNTQLQHNVYWFQSTDSLHGSHGRKSCIFVRTQFLCWLIGQFVQLIWDVRSRNSSSNNSNAF